jgi:hypothetical protein
VPVLSAVAFPSTPSPSSTATAARACRRVQSAVTRRIPPAPAGSHSEYRLRPYRCEHGTTGSRCLSSLSGAQWIEVVMTITYTRPSWAVRRVSTMLTRLVDLGVPLGSPAAPGRPPDHSGRAVPVRRTRLAGIDIRRNRMGQGRPGDRCGPAAPRSAHQDIHSGRSRRRAAYGGGGADAPADQDESACAPGTACRARSSRVPDRTAL